MNRLEQTLLDLELLIRSRYPIIYLVTYEEARSQKLLQTLAKKLEKEIYVWSVTKGFDHLTLEKPEQPLYALFHIENSPEKAIFVLQDFHVFLTPEKNFELNQVVRKIRDLADSLRRSHKTLIIQSPFLYIPPELEKDISVVDLPIPDYSEIMSILNGLLDGLKTNTQVTISKDQDLRERIVKAALGLTANEAENVFAKSIVNNRKFDVEDLQVVLEEKKQIIRKTEFLEYLDLSESMANVGGLSGLKLWLQNRSHAFSEKAKAYGLPEPKGLLLLGVQGCGKSLASKAVANLWTLPLLRMDIGKMFGKFVGDSESNMRKAILTAESLAPCVLWIDEIEKGLSGMGGGGGDHDGGVSKRLFGYFLTWMQEKKSPVFVIATANSIADLPPELLRKGRFDEIFFIDLPSIEERKSIFEIHLKKRNRAPSKFNLDALAQASDGFNGAEIEQTIISALYDTFPKNRDISDQDILTAIKQTVPLSVTMAESIADLREWAHKRARLAT